jgi:MoaA/NifB/PqqE/SkfB family radical SAM enzyme
MRPVRTVGWPIGDRAPQLASEGRWMTVRTSLPTYEHTALRQRNQALNIDEYHRRADRLESMPLAVFVELTQNCNLSCPMCRYGEKYNPDWNMPREMFEAIADELFPTAMLVDLRGWGESTILKNFDQLLDIALRYRPQLRLVTNAQVNRPDVWDQLMSAHATITVSCDAADPELFAILRRGGTIKRLRTTVGAIVAARDAYGAPRESVLFNSVVSRDNLHDLSSIIDLAADLDVPRVVFHPLVAALDDPAHLRGDLDGAARAYDAAAERARERGVVMQLGAAPDPSLALVDRVRVPPCMHPWAYAYVNYAGGVGFCDHLIGDPRYTLGSLRTSSFDEIWNGEQWAALRRSHVTGQVEDRFAPCRYSYAQRYIDFEDRVHPERARLVVSTEHDLALTARRDPQQVPAVPWTTDETPRTALPEPTLLPTPVVAPTRP